MFLRRNRRALARALGAVVSLILVAGSLGAGMPSGAASASSADRLQRLLEYNPGSVLVGPYTVRTRDGVELSLPAPPGSARNERTGLAKAERAGQASAERCSPEDLCLFQNQLYGGEKLTLSADCTYRALWQYKLSNGQTWDKHVDSYINNNPKAGTWAMLWHNHGQQDLAQMDSWELYESHRSAGPDAPSNAVSGMPWANQISVARVCQP